MLETRFSARSRSGCMDNGATISAKDVKLINDQQARVSDEALSRTRWEKSQITALAMGVSVVDPRQWIFATDLT